MLRKKRLLRSAGTYMHRFAGKKFDCGDRVGLLIGHINIIGDMDWKVIKTEREYKKTLKMPELNSL